MANISRKSGNKHKISKNQKSMWIIKGIAGILLLYILLSVVFSFKTNITTTDALKGKVVENFEAEGYVFREQTIITAPVDGYLECYSQEGDRVNEGQNVGYIYTGEFTSEKLDEIRKLNHEISKIENSLTDSKTYANNSIMIDQKIGTSSRAMSDQRLKGI